MHVCSYNYVIIIISIIIVTIITIIIIKKSLIFEERKGNLKLQKQLSLYDLRLSPTIIAKK